MSTEANKEIVRRWHEEVFNHRKLDALDEFLHLNYVGHSMNIRGVAAAQAAFTKALEATPNAQLRIDDVIAEGDKVVTRWTAHEAGSVRWTGISIHRIEAGKIVEDWAHLTETRAP